jgi:hypothetical protein
MIPINWDESRYLFLFIFIAGMLGDIVIHKSAEFDSIGLPGLGKSLLPYYSSFRRSWPKHMHYPIFKTYFYGALFGGIACMIGLLFAFIFIEISNAIEKRYKA